MSCCGSHRAVMTERHRWQIRYRGGRPIEVRGAATGKFYRFTGLAALQWVDPRDAVGWLRTQLFECVQVASMDEVSELQSEEI